MTVKWVQQLDAFAEGQPTSAVIPAHCSIGALFSASFVQDDSKCNKIVPPHE